MSDEQAEAPPPEPARGGLAFGVVRLLRPWQWSKNLLCLAGVFFSGKVFDPSALGHALGTAAVFSATSSGVYALNDALDRERDRAHPTKRNRPVASGVVAPGLAYGLAAVLAITGLAGGYALGRAVALCLALYLLNNALYSFRIKHVALLDVLSIALGFVLRLVAGVVAVGVVPTAWIVTCTLFLALFLALGKRYGELRRTLAAAEEDSSVRPALDGYTQAGLEQLLTSAATAAILAYAVFTTSSGKNPTLIVTLPVVVYGVYAYQQLVMSGEPGSEAPDLLLFRRWRFPACVVVWLALYYAVDYAGLTLFR